MKQITQTHFEGFLRQISDCFVNGDLASWRSSLRLPFSMVTISGSVLLRDDADVAANFAQYLKACEIMSLDQIIRVSKSLEDCRDGTWIGTYETHLMSNGARATRPYTSSILMLLEGDAIKATAILNARGTDEWLHSEVE